MIVRPLKLLHIEDDPTQQVLIEAFLQGMTEFRFDIVYAESEDEAVEKFKRGGVDLIILDYHLSAGDGLGCLRRIRQMDTIVPVVVVSGAATPEISGELLRFGADDYIPKQELNSVGLAQSVRQAYRRAEEWRSRRMRRSS